MNRTGEGIIPIILVDTLRTAAILMKTGVLPFLPGVALTSVRASVRFTRRFGQKDGKLKSCAFLHIISAAAAFIQGDSNLFASVGCLGVRDKNAGEDSRLLEDCCR